MKLATLFSGIGAPEVAAPPHWQRVFTAEIDPHASAVLAYRFPHTPNLGDVLDIDGSQYRNAVDIIVGGSPCQGFSAAGKRGGLRDPRSALATRFVELLAAIRPRWFLWENVSGVFSSNEGRDFAAILGCFTGRRIAPPADGKWRNTGIAAGIPAAYSVAWRVLDAQHFGVPQRRRRIFLVGHLGADWRPPTAVLIERESLSGDIAPRQKTKQEATGTLKGASRSYSHPDPSDKNGSGLVIPIHDRATRYQGGGKSRCGDGSGNGLGVGRPGDPSPTLTSGDRHAVFAFSSKDCGQDLGMIAPTLRAGEWHNSHANGGCPPAVLSGASVRKLTPLECERLMGLPDNWTKVPYGRSHTSNSARYRMLGNSIAVPCLQWISKRIEENDVCISV